MEQEKSKEQKQEQKDVKVIQPKCCPFSMGFLLEPVRTVMRDTALAKTTNVAPCMENKCKFYSEQQKECYIVLKFKEGK